jgi:hypothetical protein
LGGRFLHDWQAEEVEVLEETSIRKRDLRASYVLREHDSIEDAFVPLDYDEECDNPFVGPSEAAHSSGAAAMATTHLRSTFGRFGAARATT